MLLIKKQKYSVLAFLFCINLATIITFSFYTDKWYVYLFILALATVVNASSVLLVLGHKIKADPKTELLTKYRVKPANYIYIVPCYNEGQEELQASLDSLCQQHRLSGDRCSFLIICDGKVIGRDNLEATNIIIMKILEYTGQPIKYTYTAWDGENNSVEMYTGIYKGLPYLLIVKDRNYGKRDSLVLARKIVYNYNTQIVEDKMIPTFMMIYLGNYMNTIYDKVDYIIGIDADTVFDYHCSYELIRAMETDETIQGCVGLVDICPKMNPWNLFVLYQYAEYSFAQCLRRHTQSLITEKVSCLSGCNQILRVTNETCGEKILERFNYLPADDAHLFHHIRSYASEDRNHVCLMLSMYPYVKTKQTLLAIAYTDVPTSVAVFMSQRRRWSLGANMNDLLLTYLPGINIFERLSAGINLLTYALAPFITVATGYFIYSIITNPTYLMLYLSLPIFVIFFYALIVPIVIRPLAFRTAMYYYLSYIIFTTLGSIINLFIYVNSVSNMDVIKWGKTRGLNRGITSSNITNSIVKADIMDDLNELVYDDFLYLEPQPICANNESIYANDESYVCIV
jgi:chitin synthase